MKPPQRLLGYRSVPALQRRQAPRLQLNIAAFACRRGRYEHAPETSISRRIVARATDMRQSVHGVGHAPNGQFRAGGICSGHRWAKCGPQMGHKAKRPLRGGRCCRGFHLCKTVVAGVRSGQYRGASIRVPLTGFRSELPGYAEHGAGNTATEVPGEAPVALSLRG